MPNTAAAEALVKAYAETPAKIQEKEISITMMTKPVDLNCPVSACLKHCLICAFFMALRLALGHKNKFPSLSYPGIIIQSTDGIGQVCK